MKEYTFLTIISTFIAFLLDLKLKTFLFRKRSFAIFWLVMIIFMLIVNGYLTSRPIVLYNSDFNLGLRIFSIPVEDFLFGFSLIYFNLIIWEYSKKKCPKK
ncbi:MAG TPA: lycopene cyclase domain-containing protein [Bacteroidota bacterium]|nr:lycopene cyclase domain-containing protein [Bacteroidota bacterium]